MPDEGKTQPTLQTILDRINALDERLSVRLDRIESLASPTRAEMPTHRADFTEMRAAIREHFPAMH